MALEQRVNYLAVWAGPGQAEVLVDGLKELRTDFTAFRREVRHELGRLNAAVGGLNTDVAGLKADVSTLKTDVSGLKADVSTLKTDVAGLKTDVSELKVGMAEVLRRLPPAPTASAG